jgi:two-component system, OmpR family, KDP operon response regulator KdpE
MRILVVEDEAVNRTLLRATLSRATDARLREAGFFEATTLAEARDALAREGFDLIILDVRLPDGDGLELARETLAPGASRPRIVVLSASVLPMERDAAIEAGCDAFVAKPYRPIELLSVIEGLLPASG